MNAEIEAVFFENSNNKRLYGVLHRPERARNDVGIIILSPGIKSRVAPHRLYVKMAKRLCKKGFCVLRFDPQGIGDSEGEIEERMAADFYGSVQVGRFVRDTIDAMDWMEKEHGLSRFILAGLCGGAITGLLTGAIDQRAISLLGLGMPVILDSADTDKLKYITRGELNALGGSYFKKLFNIKSWRRFLSLKSDYRLISKSIMSLVTKQIGKHQANNASETSATSVNGLDSNFNPYFPMGMYNMLSSRKVLLIFSEADRLYWEYQEKFATPYKSMLEKHGENLEVRMVKDANHIFSFEEWNQEMLNLSCDWIQRNFHSV